MANILDELINQAKRLFSSKRNGANLIYSTIDRFHKYKLIILAVSIAFLLGYSQFRPHFVCQSQDKIPEKTITNFCWLNGTSTVDLTDEAKRELELDGNGGMSPHVGIHFRLNDGRYEVITHNYMQSLWLLLLLMSLCSVIARRYYWSIFQRDSLVALLKLPGYHELPLVKCVQNSPPYTTLLRMRNQQQKKHGSRLTGGFKGEEKQIHETFDARQQLLSIISIEEPLNETIIKMSEENEHNITLDYYVNQLLYFLLAIRPAAYKISGLKLKSRLIKYHFVSVILSSIQFVLPRLFIGKKYNLYGWHFSEAWWDYIHKHILNSDNSSEPNQVTYDISAQIWPTSVMCQYEQFGYVQMERVTVQCTVGINEICAKFFAVIWWVIILSLLVEVYSFLIIIMSSLSYDITRNIFGYRYWPKVMDEVDNIATFRWQNNILISQLKNCITNSQSSTNTSSDMINEADRKHLEAREEYNSGFSSASCLSFISCLLPQHDHSELDFMSSEHHFVRKTKSLPDENGFKETQHDSNMLFLLYLLCHRLRCSSKKTQLIIRATNRALLIYLDTLKESLHRQLDAQSISRCDQDVASGSVTKLKDVNGGPDISQA